MPDIKVLKSSEGKRIDLSDFYEDAWLTVKRIPYTIKKQIEKLYIKTPIVQAGKKIAEKQKAGEDIDNIDYLDMLNEIDDEQYDKFADNQTQIDRLYIKFGLDPFKHNFTEDGKQIEINDDFVEWVLSNKELATYINKEIQNYNQSVTIPEENSGK